MKKSCVWTMLLLFAMTSYAASSWEKGWKAYNKHEYGEAISYFKKAVEENPQDGSYFRWLGHAYYENGQFQEASDAYKRALALPQGTAFVFESWLWLAEAQGKMGLYEAAILSWKKYIELKPDDPTGFAKLSHAYIGNKQYDEALTAARRAIELKTDFASAYYYLGVAYRMKKQSAEALQADKKAMELDPASSLYPYEMGHLLYEKEEYAEAAAAYKKTLELEPKSNEALKMLAASYRLTGKYDDAIATINRLLALQSYAGIGVTLALDSGYPVIKEVLEAGPASKAGIEVGDRIVKINGNKTKGWSMDRASLIMRGAVGSQFLLTIERNGIDEAIEKKAMRETMFEKSAASALGVRSDLYRYKGSLEAALLDAQRAYALDPADSWACYSLGAADLDRGQYDESIKLLARVKNSARARVLEATAYAKQGKMKEAEEHLLVHSRRGIVFKEHSPDE